MKNKKILLFVLIMVILILGSRFLLTRYFNQKINFEKNKQSEYLELISNLRTDYNELDIEKLLLGSNIEKAIFYHFDSKDETIVYEEMANIIKLENIYSEDYSIVVKENSNSMLLRDFNRLIISDENIDFKSLKSLEIKLTFFAEELATIEKIIQNINNSNRIYIIENMSYNVPNGIFEKVDMSITAFYFD